MKSTSEIVLLLHDIRSVYNAGAVFRTADAIGASKIYITGYTPTPVDRFRQPRADFAKCALGAEKSVAWEYAKTPGPVIARLKEEGFEVVALEQSERSVDYKKFTAGAKTLVIFGNEVSGISRSILAKVDVIAEIPMRGRKESLNVSVSAGIALFRWFDR
ncbi:MAG TPA: TrmH family RNA methyltransferase [Candidatus Paceibacterota bacterium]|jgi:tRNA G18 (ribose-2'-O)-methylase SpoU|nr:TrmH family RNA methyltransferase [Candidatus Paceibacterota bacterium]